MSLKQSATSGVKWLGATKAISIVIEFLKLAILAHLLSPGDFGLMGMVRVIIGFAHNFEDMGISNALIYRQDANQDQLSTLYWLSIAAGVCLFAIVWALTPLVIRFYKEPRLSSLIFWAALSFLIIPIGHQFQVLMQKEFRFANLAKIEVIAAIGGALVAIFSAFVGQGVFSLIWGQLMSSTIMTLLFIILGFKIWRPHLHFRKNDLEGYLGFGLYQMGERGLNYFSSNVDYLVVGRFLGAEILGFYTMAYELMVRPIALINPVFTRVAFPVFAKKQSDDAALRYGYLEMIKLLAFIAFPILVGLGVVAPIAIPLIWGPQWMPAINLIQIFVLLGILKTLGNPMGSIWLAKGRADIGFVWNVFVVIINTLVFWYIIRFGIHVMAWSETVLNVFYFICGLWILRFIIGLEIREYLSILWRPVTMTTVMGLIVFAVYLTLIKFSINKIFLLGGLISLGILLYGVLILRFQKRYIIELKNLMINKKEYLQQCRD